MRPTPRHRRGSASLEHLLGIAGAVLGFGVLGAALTLAWCQADAFLLAVLGAGLP